MLVMPTLGLVSTALSARFYELNGAQPQFFTTQPWAV